MLDLARYTLQEISAKPQQNVTLSAPLEHINVHARGGTVFVLQEPGYTTTDTKNSPYSLLVTLDDKGAAEGSVYLDDGVSLAPASTKVVTVSLPQDAQDASSPKTDTSQFNYANGCLRSTIDGTFEEVAPLANITIAGLAKKPSGCSMHGTGLDYEYENGVLYITGMKQLTEGGAFAKELEVRLS
jgi:alpha-glucosidase